MIIILNTRYLTIHNYTYKAGDIINSCNILPKYIVKLGIKQHNTIVILIKIS